MRALAYPLDSRPHERLRNTLHEAQGVYGPFKRAAECRASLPLARYRDEANGAPHSGHRFGVARKS